MKKCLKILLIPLIFIHMVGCNSQTSQPQMDVTQALNKNADIPVGSGNIPSEGNVNSTPSAPVDAANPVAAVESAEANTTKEKTVIISLNNFGRSNPFKPYQERSLVTNMSPYNLPELSNVPPPPSYLPDPAAKKLIEIKVNGILFDFKKSSAIVTIDKTDYMVHKGDKIFDYYIKDIRADKVVIKTGNNEYQTGVGEIIYGEVNQDPVQGSTRFGGSQRVSSLPEIKVVNPTYISSR